ncbi:MAG: hypothetical protein QW315_06215, partial [Candidatus Hadarchaeum sp.]
MIGNEESRRPESRHFRPVGGWTNVHSWIFLGIIAFAVIMLGLQNRYHYLSPLGLGKAYRIDKLFGGIQEFDPDKGWIVAQLQVMPPQHAMMESPSRAVPMNMPGTGEAIDPSVLRYKEDTLTTGGKESPGPPSVVQTPASKETELSNEEKFKVFQKAFPEFGQDEFQLANDDLYP